MINIYIYIYIHRYIYMYKKQFLSASRDPANPRSCAAFVPSRSLLLGCCTIQESPTTNPPKAPNPKPHKP